MSIPGGYILLARKLLDVSSNPDAANLMERPPLYLKLWIWMLGKANWKDRDKLKRGQFVTTIAEMREAMSYKIGYRKKTPTIDQIRSAYEAFAKATMITTTKTTRGMIITILNYSKYQDPKNYEPHSEAHDEDLAKPTVTPHDTEEREEKKKIKRSASGPADAGDEQRQAYLTKRKRRLTGKRLSWFNRFWEAFAYKKGKAEAADAWLDIPEPTDTLCARVVQAAQEETRRRPGIIDKGRTPIMAQGWLSGRRWEDEDLQPSQTPQKTPDDRRREFLSFPDDLKPLYLRDYSDVLTPDEMSGFQEVAACAS